jgi:thiamine biosynthesis lipoprotein
MRMIQPGQGRTPRACRGLGAVALVALAAGLAAFATARGDAARRSVTWPMRTMGTYANVTIVTDDSAAAAPAARIAQSALARVDSLMSNWTTTSEVARLNRECGSGAVRVEPEVARVIAASLDVWRGSEGTFDITVEPLVRAWGFIGGHPHVPSDSEATVAARRVGARQLRFDAAAGTLAYENPGVRIDLGGIAKGYAVDVAAESLVARGVTDALVDLTGNMMALGRPANAPAWRIGIRDPRDRVPYFARITLSGEGISTSGKYEQFVAADGTTYGHIMDPRTGRPADGMLSVTLISKSAFTCDGWDTPLFVLGPVKARALARAHADFDAILVTPGPAGVDTVWVEAPLMSRFTLEPDARAMFRVVPF